METVRQVIEWVALSIEMLAVAVIVGSIALALMSSDMSRNSWRAEAGRSDIFGRFKRRMGRGLLLGLELLLAADIISTVALTSTLQSLGELGLLAVIRSFLSWSLDVEIDGCWPWRVRDRTRAAADARPASPTLTASTNE